MHQIHTFENSLLVQISRVKKQKDVATTTRRCRPKRGVLDNDDDNGESLDGDKSNITDSGDRGTVDCCQIFEVFLKPNNKLKYNERLSKIV